MCYACPALQWSETYSAGFSCATHPDTYTVPALGLASHTAA